MPSKKQKWERLDWASSTKQVPSTKQMPFTERKSEVIESPCPPEVDQAEFVDIIVTEPGPVPKTKQYSLRRDRLQKHSDYFRVVLNPASPWKREKDGVLKIEEYIDVFDIFERWLHYGILKKPCQKRDPNSGTYQPKYLDNKLTCAVYVFADFRSIPALANDAVGMLSEYTRTTKQPVLGKHNTALADYINDNIIADNDVLKSLIFDRQKQGIE